MQSAYANVLKRCFEEPEVKPVRGGTVRIGRPSRKNCPPPDERALELCEGLIDMSAALFNVSGKDLRQAGRTNLDVSRVRQIAMYVAHVALQLNMTDIGRGFGRDRTTVLHSCHLIEDLRDDQDFDSIVAMVERVALAAFRYRLGL